MRFPLGFLPVALTLLLACGCVQQQDMDQLKSRVNSQDQRIAQLSNQLSGVQPAQADIWSQVQDMHQDMAYMKGRMEMLESNAAASQELAEMRARLNRHEQALRRIAADFALDLPMLDPAPASADQSPYAGLLPDPDAALNQPVSGQPVNGQPVNGQPVSGQPDPALPDAQQPGATQPIGAAAQDMAAALYEQGIAFFNNRQYDNALRNFKDFTDVYPDHTLAANAWFWQGEAYYQLKNYVDAAVAYEQVIAKFPRSAKYPSALMKQGICLFSLGKPDVARLRLNEAIQKFPGSPEAVRAQRFIDENY